METVIRMMDALLAAMEQERRLVGDLIGLAEEKASLLPRADAESLNGVLQREEETLIALHETEEERKAYAGRLGDKLCLAGEEPTLKKLARGFDHPEYSLRLICAGNEMTKAMRRLSRCNSKVKELLKHQIGYTAFLLNVLNGPQSKADFYNMQGSREEKTTHKSRLDYHA